MQFYWLAPTLLAAVPIPPAGITLTIDDKGISGEYQVKAETSGETDVQRNFKAPATSFDLEGLINNKLYTVYLKFCEPFCSDYSSGMQATTLKKGISSSSCIYLCK